jgi:glycosyltransferase involved in cell wall biosynthesis
VRVLFLHSGTELTGSYTYAKALEKAWDRPGEIYYINDGMAGAVAPAEALPLGKKLFPQGLLNGFKVAQFIRRNRIDIIHSHSRRANMVAAMASQQTGVPYVTTAHLSQRPHLFTRWWPCFGDRTIAICENIQDNLIHAHSLNPSRVHLIRNGIDLQLFSPRAMAGHTRWISIVGRLSGRRWRAGVFLMSLLPELLRSFTDIKVRFLGSVAAEHEPEFHARLAQLNSGFREPRVMPLGFAPDLRPFLAESSVVVGAGRSILEAMAMERPVVAVGEQEAPGLLTMENFAEAQASNFGDFRKRSDGSAIYNAEKIRQDLTAILNGKKQWAGLARWGREQVDAHYNITRVAVKVEGVYAAVQN